MARSLPTATPRRSGPGRLDAAAAAELPERLLDAAQAVFTRGGYARATMDAIARAAGTTRKTLYARHAGKAEMLSAVVARLLDRALAAMRPTAWPGLAAPEGLRRLATELVELTVEDDVAALNRLILSEATHVPELGRLFVDLHERAVDAVARQLDAWRVRGELPGLPADADAGVAAALFVEMTCSLPRLRAVLGIPMPRGERAAHVDHAVELFLAACGAGASLRPPARTTPPTAPPPPPPAPRRAARTRR